MIRHTENDSELKRPIGLYFFYCLLIQLNSDLLLPRDKQIFLKNLKLLFCINTHLQYNGMNRFMV